ncbi:MAG: hypothetical protein JRH20_21340 [Deltaproteobacteria bacterium]|nr:hypothetical protein [Deltaproteobacteria bacterium]
MKRQLWVIALMVSLLVVPVVLFWSAPAHAGGFGRWAGSITRGPIRAYRVAPREFPADGVKTKQDKRVKPTLSSILRAKKTVKKRQPSSPLSSLAAMATRTTIVKWFATRMGSFCAMAKTITVPVTPASRIYSASLVPARLVL